MIILSGILASVQIAAMIWVMDSAKNFGIRELPQRQPKDISVTFRMYRINLDGDSSII